MSENNTTTATKRGLGFPAILTIIFVIAKLLGIVTWGWLIVFLPVILQAALTILFLIVAAIIGVITQLLK